MPAARRLAAGQRDLDAGRATLVAGQRKLDAGTATIKDKQAEIDDGRAEARRRPGGHRRRLGDHPREAGRDRRRPRAARRPRPTSSRPARRCSTSPSGVRLVSEDGSAAVAAVMFDATQTAIPVETKDAPHGRLPRRRPSTASRSTSPRPSHPRCPRSSAAARPSASWSPRSCCSSCSARSIGAGLPIITALLGVGIGVLGAMSLSERRRDGVRDARPWA